MDELIPKVPSILDYYDEYQSLIPIRKAKIDLYKELDSLIPISIRNNLNYNFGNQLIPILSQHIDLYKQQESLIPTYTRVDSTYKMALQGSDAPIDRSYIEDVISRLKNIPRQGFKNSNYIVVKTTENSEDRSYIQDYNASNNIVISNGRLIEDYNTINNTSYDSLDRSYIPIASMKDDEYNERERLIPIARGGLLRMDNIVYNTILFKNQSEKVITGIGSSTFTKLGIIIPPMISFWPPKLSLNLYKVNFLKLNNFKYDRSYIPQTINALGIIGDLLMGNSPKFNNFGNFLGQINHPYRRVWPWQYNKLIGNLNRSYIGNAGFISPPRTIISFPIINNQPTQGKNDIGKYSPISKSVIKGRNVDTVESFIGQLTNDQFIPNILNIIQTKPQVTDKVNTYSKSELSFKESVLAYSKKRNELFSKSTYINSNTKDHFGYFEQNDNPIPFLFRTSIPSKSTAQSSFKFGRDTEAYNFVLTDPLSYQIESYKTSIFRGVTYSAENIAGSKEDPNSNFNGNLIKFWIKNLNDNSVMTTPAFLSEIQDGGGNGTWDQVTYVNSYYPKFVYKGAQKRTITFTLKLACFDKQYFPQYLQKLNFLRTVGFPFYQGISIPRTNVSNQNETNTGVDPLTVMMGKAPVYSLTLGDIVREQEGYFQACDFSWDDEQSSWILNPLKMFGAKNNVVINSNNSGTEDILRDVIFTQLEIPIVTTINCTFVCMYGLGPSSNYIDNTHYVYDSEYFKQQRESYQDQ